MADEEVSFVDKIDNALAQYYKKLNRIYKNANGIGKFKQYCQENGFDEDEIREDLDQQNATDSSLTEIDMDEDEEVILFPFADAIDDEEEKQKEIVRILRDIVKFGRITQKIRPMNLSVDICTGLTSKQVAELSKIYTQQLANVDGKSDKDLKYFLAIGLKENFPFLTYMIDSFTRQKAEHHYKNKDKEDENNVQNLTVAVWAKKNTFCRALKKKDKNLAVMLTQAMVSYSNRIMGRLQFEPSYLVEDSLRQIAEYAVAMPLFIKNLIDNDANKAMPAFQVDLMIAVRKSITAFAETHSHSDDDEELSHDEEKDADASIDHIGSIHDNFDKLGTYHTSPANEKDDDQKDANERLEAIQRSIGEKYKEFRTILSKAKAEHFDAETYPHQRRLCLFVDRRGDNDEMTMFEPPSGCNKIERDSVHEIGFEFLRKCMIPKSDGHITAIDRLCGQLMTFMFNVDARDEMRCYLVWNGQTMRFHGEHIFQILPNIFVDKEYKNKEFVAGEQPKKLANQFDGLMEDTKFERFYKALTEFEAK